MYTKTAALLVVALTATACGSSRDSGAAARNALLVPSAVGGPGAAAAAAQAGASVQASTGCLLTGSQVSTAMGSTYADPTAAGGICSYAGSGNTVTIAVTTGTFAAALAKLQGAQTPTTITGLGDQAVGLGHEILVASGSTLIDIGGADATGGGPWPKSTDLARLIVARLP